MLQALKLNNEKWKKSSFYEEKSLVGLTLDLSLLELSLQRYLANFINKWQEPFYSILLKCSLFCEKNQPTRINVVACFFIR